MRAAGADVHLAAIAHALLLLLLLLLFSSVAADGDGLPPFLSPFLNASAACDGVQCGKGTCRPSANRTLAAFFRLGFTCECDPGWTKFINDDTFQFLPCVLPNCTMNYSCSREALAPIPPPPEIPLNRSIFDPCVFAMCGQGTCVKTSDISHRCECKLGYGNLLGINNFPCFQNCVLGADCAQLGLALPNSSGLSPPNLSAGSDLSPGAGKPPNQSAVAPAQGRAIRGTPQYFLMLLFILILLPLS